MMTTTNDLKKPIKVVPGAVTYTQSGRVRNKKDSPRPLDLMGPIFCTHINVLGHVCSKRAMHTWIVECSNFYGQATPVAIGVCSYHDRWYSGNLPKDDPDSKEGN